MSNVEEETAAAETDEVILVTMALSSPSEAPAWRVRKSMNST